MKKDKIVIYTNENCPSCKELKQLLEDNNVKFIEKYNLTK